jgi:hypothetical protein
MDVIKIGGPTSADVITRGAREDGTEPGAASGAMLGPAELGGVLAHSARETGTDSEFACQLLVGDPF